MIPPITQATEVRSARSRISAWFIRFMFVRLLYDKRHLISSAPVPVHQVSLCYFTKSPMTGTVPQISVIRPTVWSLSA
jgi:hypothetical protein